MSLRHRLLSRLRRALADEPPPLRLEFWDGEVFDFTAGPAVTLRIKSASVMRDFVTGRMAKLGDAYVAGDIAVDGRIEDILHIGIGLAERIGKLSRLAALARPLGRLAFRHSRRNDAAAIAHHYDVSNDFYRLWLDPSMTYSCAYFLDGTEDIARAQEQKIAHICAKLRLQPGERLLDIGCGWGGLLRAAAHRYDITGLGVTNSPAQYDYAHARVVAEGIDDKIEIRLQDYRDIQGEGLFDKIVSVGMYEHVGLKNLPLYFAAIARLLKPGGALLNHGIIVTDPAGHAQGPPGGEFIDRHVFPGGELPNLSHLIGEIAQSRLEPVDVEDLRPHYARTLLLWLRRLEGSREAILKSAGAERYRVWRIFLAGMAYAFDCGWLSVAQVLAYKPVNGHPAPRPWSRNYQYHQHTAPTLAAALDWTDVPLGDASVGNGTFQGSARIVRS